MQGERNWPNWAFLWPISAHGQPDRPTSPSSSCTDRERDLAFQLGYGVSPLPSAPNRRPHYLHLSLLSLAPRRTVTLSSPLPRRRSSLPSLRRRDVRDGQKLPSLVDGHRVPATLLVSLGGNFFDRGTRSRTGRLSAPSSPPTNSADTGASPSTASSSPATATALLSPPSCPR